MPVPGVAVGVPTTDPIAGNSRRQNKLEFHGKLAFVRMRRQATQKPTRVQKLLRVILYRQAKTEDVHHQPNL